MTGRTNLGVTRSLAFILIYVFQLLGGIVFLISDRNDREIRYHARMSCLLCITEILSAVILKTLGKIPYLGWIFTLGLWIISVAYVVVMILCMVRALNGSEMRLPFYHNLASRNL